MADYARVHIKRLGKPKLHRLMKGGAIRIEKPTSVEDAMELFLLPHHMKAINKKFNLGKLHQMRLSPEELKQNMMEGGSLSETVSKYGRAGLKYSAPMLKQLARAGITAGAAAAATGATATAQPYLVPFIPGAAAAAGVLSDKMFDDLANMELDEAGEGTFSPQNVSAYTDYARQQAMNHPQYQRAVYNTSKYVPSDYGQRLSKYDVGSGNDGYLERSGYGNLESSYRRTDNALRSASARQRPSRRQSREMAYEYQSGRGLYASNMRGYGLHSGGKLSSVLSNRLLNHYSMYPNQSLVSQPMAVNLASKAFQPVGLQSFIN